MNTELAAFFIFLSGAGCAGIGFFFSHQEIRKLVRKIKAQEDEIEHHKFMSNHYERQYEDLYDRYIMGEREVYGNLNNESARKALAKLVFLARNGGSLEKIRKTLISWEDFKPKNEGQ